MNLFIVSVTMMTVFFGSMSFARHHKNCTKEYVNRVEACSFNNWSKPWKSPGRDTIYLCLTSNVPPRVVTKCKKHFPYWVLAKQCIKNYLSLCATTPNCCDDTCSTPKRRQ